MRIFPVILLVLAAAFLFGGIKLIALGGSPYYVWAAAGLAATAVLLWRGTRWGVWLYAGVFGATLVWALWEVGGDPWALLPRLWLLAILGGWLALPYARRCLNRGPSLALHGRTVPIMAAVAISGVSAVLYHSPGLAQPERDSNAFNSSSAAQSDWAEYGGTATGARFSALTEITPANVQQLRVAWTFHVGEADPQGMEVTPLKVGDTVYVCTGTNLVVAVNADTGQERWRYDPRSVLKGPCRGVAHYVVPGATGKCSERIYTNTFDARLFSLDARTGRPCEDFGSHGQIQLKDGMRPVGPGQYMLTSAPTLARGRIVVGGLALAVKGFDEPSGVIRAFDAVTGKLAWAYDAGHPDRIGAPPDGQFYTVGMPNAWAPMAYDDTLGLVYVPTAGAGAAYYGAKRRPVDDDISTSVMALDVETGRRRWIFQTVHHDLWDYDVASQPMLVDIQRGGKTIRALVQPTKLGETFVLDRVTGVPVDPVVERRVNTVGAVRGERLSPTQPFSAKVPSLAGGPVREQDMWGLTPFDQMWCRIKFREARYEGPMTPPGLTPSLQSPGWLGGMDWGSASVDGDHGLMLVVTNYVANYVQMRPLTARGAARGKVDKNDLAAYALQADVPYTNSTLPFLSPIGVPCQQPPWSRLSAIDLVNHRVLWSHPLGTGKDNGPFGIASRLPVPIGVPALGGVLVTRGGLTFVGASTDRTFRAFETATGRLLWQAALPASGNATPISYADSAGAQIVLIPAGGHKILGGVRSDTLIAYALARPGSRPTGSAR